MSKKLQVLFLGFGQAGREHFNAIRRVFRGYSLSVEVIDLDERLLDYPGLQREDFTPPKLRGLVVDARPWQIRELYPSNVIADRYFREYLLVEEKPVSTGAGASAHVVNTFRRFAPSWKRLIGTLNERTEPIRKVEIKEIDPCFKNGFDRDLAFDILPHAFSFYEDLCEESAVLTDDFRLSGNKFTYQDKLNIEFLYGRAPSCIVSVVTDSTTAVYFWPSEELIMSRFDALRIFDPFRAKFRLSLVFHNIARLLSPIRELSLYSRFSDTYIQFAAALSGSDFHNDIDAQRQLSKWMLQNGRNYNNANKTIGAGIKYSHVIFGASSSIGRQFLSRLLDIGSSATVLLINRRHVVDQPAMLLEDFFSNVPDIEGAKVYYFMSAMGGPTPHQVSHNRILSKVLDECIKSHASTFYYISSRAIFLNPNSPDDGRHTVESAKLRGPYSYGKLIDTNIVEEKCDSANINLVIFYPGVVRTPDVDFEYGVSFRFLWTRWIFGSKTLRVSYCLMDDLCNSLMAERALTHKFVTLGELYSNRFGSELRIFIPKFLTRIICGVLGGFYRRLRPEENLWSKLKHFYAG